MSQDRAAEEAKQAYTRAVSSGASIHVAFDLACNAYRAWHPELEGPALRVLVARGAALSREDRLRIEVGLFSA